MPPDLYSTISVHVCDFFVLGALCPSGHRLGWMSARISHECSYACGVEFVVGLLMSHVGFWIHKLCLKVRALMLLRGLP